MATTELSSAEFPPSELDQGSNVLLLARENEAATQACTDLVTTVAREPDDALLAVTLKQAPMERVDTWRAHTDHALPDELVLVALGEETTVDVDDSRVTVRTLSDSRNLTQLGVEVTQGLTALADDDRRVAVCFDSVTALLQANPTDRVFRFLHVLTGQVAGADAIGHYHLDPSGHNEQTVNTLVSLFDAVIKRTDAGEWRIRTWRRSGT